MRADAGLLDRVLANILENALRHSPGRREVVVQAGRLGDRVQIRVVDRGPGVPDEAKDQIFAPFQRGGTHRGARAWASAWPSPGVSPRRWTAPSGPRTRPVAG